MNYYYNLEKDSSVKAYKDIYEIDRDSDLMKSIKKNKKYPGNNKIKWL